MRAAVLGLIIGFLLLIGFWVVAGDVTLGCYPSLHHPFYNLDHYNPHPR